MSDVIWLTGSASGIGLHLTQCFIRRNYRVVATDVAFDQLKDIAHREQWDRSRVLVDRLDVTDPDDWAMVFGRVMERWGKIDTLMNIAGYLKPGYVHAIDPAEIDRHMDINVKGVIYGSQLVARRMVDQGYGHIVNMASLAGIAPIPGIALYSASKYAVRGFSLALAEELREHGVAVTVICPDAIQTPMLVRQETYEEAALTFSGPRALTLEEIEALVFREVMRYRPLERVIPWHRGVLAKLNNVFPGLAHYLVGALKRRGQQVQEKRRAGRGQTS